MQTTLDMSSDRIGLLFKFLLFFSPYFNSNGIFKQVYIYFSVNGC